jgi:hypothetical protein
VIVTFTRQQRAILEAALEDIENLAAPREIDKVCAVLRRDIVDFARLGTAGMTKVILAALNGDQEGSSSLH